VPLAAIIGVLARFVLRQYLASPYYRGHAGPVPKTPVPQTHAEP
jgi:hypothetical protein